jgi:hypothetical protein
MNDIEAMGQIATAHLKTSKENSELKAEIRRLKATINTKNGMLKGALSMLELGFYDESQTLERMRWALNYAS